VSLLSSAGWNCSRSVEAGGGYTHIDVDGGKDIGWGQPCPPIH